MPYLTSLYMKGIHLWLNYHSYEPKSKHYNESNEKKLFVYIYTRILKTKAEGKTFHVSGHY